MSTATAGAGTKHCRECGVEISAEAVICPECGVELDGTTDTGQGSDPSSRILAAIVGGVISFLIGWIPVVGPIPGGAVAGYLRGDDVKESALTGLLANVLAAVPAILLAGLFLVLGGIGAAVDGDGTAALGIFVWLLIFAGSFLYFFGFGALGGAIGAKLTDRRAP